LGRRRKRDWPSVHVFLYFTGPGLSRLVFDRMATRMRKMGFFIWEMHIYHRDLNWLEKASMKVSAPSLEAVRELLRPLRNLGLARSLPGLKKPFPSAREWEEALEEAGIPELARLLSVLASVRARKAYLIWRDPRLPLGACPLDELLRPEWRERLAPEASA